MAVTSFHRCDPPNVLNGLRSQLKGLSHGGQKVDAQNQAAFREDDPAVWLLRPNPR
jgi:hypothetical protein